MAFNPLSDDDGNDIGLGDEDKDRVKSSKVDWYKGEKGRTDRVAFVYFHTNEMTALRKALKANPKLDEAGKKKVLEDCKAAIVAKSKTPDQLSPMETLDLSECKFKVNDIHFKEGQGFGYIVSRLGKDGDEADEVWKRLPAAKTTVTTCLVIYPTNRDGELEKERIASTRVLPWKFSGEKWDVIRRINKGLLESGHTIGEYDLNFACSETQYQKIAITQAGPALWRRNPEFCKMVLTKAMVLYDKLVPGKILTTDELRGKFGIAAAGPSDTISDVSFDFANVLNTV